MTDSNKIIQSLWVGSELSNVEKLCIKSFLTNGHGFHLYVYEDVKGVPDGTTLKDANEILSKDKIFTYKTEGFGKGGYSGFADLFRYNLLYIRGGWWVDTDVVCLKTVDHESEVVISSSFEDQWGENLPNACQLKFPKGHVFLEKAIEYCVPIDLKNVKYGQIDPHLVQRLTKELNLTSYVTSYYHFNPIAWRFVTDYIAYEKQPLKIN